MYRKITIFFLLILLTGTSSCSLHSGSTYEQNDMGSPVYFNKGVIISVRDVEIKGTESGAGAVAGSVVGYGGWQTDTGTAIQWIWRCI